MYITSAQVHPPPILNNILAKETFVANWKTGNKTREKKYISIKTF
jgi:hypothetical protein